MMVPPALTTGILCFLLLYACHAPISASWPKSDGVVTPRDPYKFVGETLTLFCNITNENWPGHSSALFFEKTTLDGDTKLDKRLVKELTTKSIKLTYPRLKIKDEGNYVCLETTVQGKNKTIGHQVVRVDYKPQKVEMIACRVYNWESMTCNWTLGVKYKHPEEMKVSLTWTVSVPESSDSYGSQKVCPDNNMRSNESCHWPLKHYKHGNVYIMKISVETHAPGRKKESAFSPQFKIETKLYVEPAPIHNFQAVEENSTCIILSWNHSSRPSREKSFEAEYRNSSSSSWVTIHLDEWAMKNMKTWVSGLTPFTAYTFRMSVLPYPSHADAQATHGYRSKWIQVSATTRADVPGSSPQLCHSCYSVRRCHHQKNNTGCRLVRIYWKKIPLHHQHGEIKEYAIRFIKDGSLFLEDNVEVGNTNQEFQISDAQYEVQLSAVGSKGFSKVPSILTIPALLKRPSHPRRFLVETDVGYYPPKYYLSWQTLKASPMNYSGVTVVWCHGSTLGYACNGDINWKHIPVADDEGTTVLEPGSDVKVHHIIGVGAEVSQANKIVSSGIQWSSCIYERDKKPKHMPKNVHWSETQPFDGLTILWDKSDCSEEKVFVTEYKVSLCRTLDEMMCHEPMINITTKAKTEVTFSRLQSKKKYLARVRAMSPAGFGPSSPPIVATVAYQTIPEEADESYIVVIVVISLVLLCVLCLTLWCCCRHIRHRLKRRHPILCEPIPHYAESVRDTNPGSRKSDSSGSSSDVTSNQSQPLIKPQHSESGNADPYMILTKEDDYYDGTISKQQFIDKHGRFPSMNGSRYCDSHEYHPHSVKYETPVTTPDKDESFQPLFHRQNTLPMRTFQPIVLVRDGVSVRSAGQPLNNAHQTRVCDCQHESNIPPQPPDSLPLNSPLQLPISIFPNSAPQPPSSQPPSSPPQPPTSHPPSSPPQPPSSLPPSSPLQPPSSLPPSSPLQPPSSLLPTSPPQPPASKPPPLPAREPLADNPPLFPAPPPPKTKKRKTSGQYNWDLNPSLDGITTDIPMSPCDTVETPPQGYSHFQDSRNFSMLQPTGGSLWVDEDSNATASQVGQNSLPPSFHIPGPPPFPPSPDPSSQIPGDLNIPNLINEEPSTLPPSIQSQNTNTTSFRPCTYSENVSLHSPDYVSDPSLIHHPATNNNTEKCQPSNPNTPDTSSSSPPILDLPRSTNVNERDSIPNVIPNTSSLPSEVPQFSMDEENQDLPMDSPDTDMQEGTSYIQCMEATFKNSPLQSQNPIFLDR